MFQLLALLGGAVHAIELCGENQHKLLNSQAEVLVDISKTPIKGESGD